MKKKFLISLLLTITILTAIFSTVYATDEQTEIPTAYDLRNDISIRVESQGQRHWCNAYATTKLIETYLQKTRGINYNLSEAYMAYSQATYFGGIFPDKKDIESVNDTSVLYEGGKLVLERDFPNKDYDFTEINKNKFDKATTKAVVKSVITKNLKTDEEIKKYVMINGGVNVITLEPNNVDYYNPTTCAIYHSNSFSSYIKDSEDTKGHAVVIIGWNDNYSKNNFNSNCRPNSDGAWLVLNSWGSDWGNNGTAWLSYEDTIMKEFTIQGIESVALPGELNAQFSYMYNGEGLFTAQIKVYDEIEDINGWSRSDDSTYIKVFKEQFEPYTIELHSKTDDSKTTVDINIPKEEFEKAEQELREKKEAEIQMQYEHEQREKELEQIRKNSKAYKLDVMIIIICVIILILFILFIIILARKKKKKMQNEEDKGKSKFVSRIIVIILILLFLAILFTT